MNWLKIFLVYYILLYLGGGGIAVDIFGVTDWEAMFLMFVGCCLGHYMGKIDAVGYR